MGTFSSKPGLPRPYVLLTGATGLLGQYLMRDLLLAGHRLAVVVRPTRRESGHARIEQILQRMETEAGRGLPRPIVLDGDIQQAGFGLSDDDWQFIASHCDRMLHNAAVLQFHGVDPGGEPWTTNVGGTRNALEICRQTGISHFHYMSTAYVCGNREGIILESEFDQGQSFRNDYEQSKFEAEKIVRESRDFRSVTIYRPVVVAGDSKTGFTSTYHGLFVYLRLFAMFVPHQERGPDGRILTQVRIPLEGDEPRNVVPVEWVSAVVQRLFDNEAAHGTTCHIAPDRKLTARQVIEACYDYFNSHGVEFGVDAESQFSQPEFARQILDNVAIYSQYECSDPEFDTTTMKQFAGDIPCPEIDRDTIIRFLEFGESDQWGKRRATAIVAVDPRRTLQMLEAFAASAGRCGPTGLRLLGPGGGDWTIVGGSSVDEPRFLRGIGGAINRIVTLETRQFQPGETPISPASPGPTTEAVVTDWLADSHFN